MTSAKRIHMQVECAQILDSFLTLCYNYTQRLCGEGGIFVANAMKKYLEEARDFLNEAEGEYERGERERNIILMRDACEKAWGGVIQALNAFFIFKDVSPLPRSHRDRRLKLRELEWGDEAVREKALLDRFMARAHVLHERAFYDGDIVPSEAKDEFEKAKSFIKDMEELISQRREGRCLDT